MTVEPLPGAILNVSARTISKRYTNFINSETIGGYTVVNAYRDLGDGLFPAPLEKVSVRLNVDNLFDKDYLGTITTTTNTPATFRPGPRRTVQVTLSAAY